jgi:CRISPR-associated protein Cmr4
MYQKAYGIIETLAPLHVGASSGEENGNLNLIFRDQFTQTGIIPGSSIRGRFRADMRLRSNGSEHKWYGHDAISGSEKNTTEAIVKFEYASIVWLPVYCPGQPVIMVSSPMLLERYHKITGKGKLDDIKPYIHSGVTREKLFFNIGFINLGAKSENQLKPFKECAGTLANRYGFVIVDDSDIALIHDMSLYRQSRVKLKDDEKIVDGKGFFNVEALPEKTILVFPLALNKHHEEQLPDDKNKKIKKEVKWDDYIQDSGFKPNNISSESETPQSQELYFGGLESIGFGRTSVTLHHLKEKLN